MTHVQESLVSESTYVLFQVDVSMKLNYILKLYACCRHPILHRHFKNSKKLEMKKSKNRKNKKNQIKIENHKKRQKTTWNKAG